MLRAPRRSPLLTTALLLSAVGLFFCEISSTLLAESMSRSDAQTAGEKRLLDWDLSKSYNLSGSRTGSKEQAPSRSFAAQSFRPGGFRTKPFSTEAFASPEFLTPEGRAPAKTFQTKPAFAIPASASSKPLLPTPPLNPPPKVVPTVATVSTSASNSPKQFAEAARLFQGPEAARKDRKYTPGTAPTGGMIEGRKLSTDEVREILNKSK